MAIRHVAHHGPRLTGLEFRITSSRPDEIMKQIVACGIFSRRFFAYLVVWRDKGSQREIVIHAPVLTKNRQKQFAPSRRLNQVGPDTLFEYRGPIGPTLFDIDLQLDQQSLEPVIGLVQ